MLTILAEQAELPIRHLLSHEEELSDDVTTALWSVRTKLIQMWQLIDYAENLGDDE